MFKLLETYQARWEPDKSKFSVNDTRIFRRHYISDKNSHVKKTELQSGTLSFDILEKSRKEQINDCCNCNRCFGKCRSLLKNR